MSLRPPPFETGSRAHVSDSLLDKSYTVVKAVYEDLATLEKIGELLPFFEQLDTVLGGQLLYKAEMSVVLPSDGTTTVVLPWPATYAIADVKSVFLWGNTTDGRRYAYQDFFLGSSGITIRVDTQAPANKQGITVDLVLLLVANIPEPTPV